ncbi:MAG: hypothetical protein WDO12_04280 [Pseudomonadota bacterium]
MGNVAAGSDATGFWFAFPDHPTGAFEGSDTSKNTWPGQTKIREFKGNVAHSNFDSLMQDRGPLPNGHTRAYGYIAFATPGQRVNPVESVVEDFTSYKNRNSGIWARGEMHVYKGPEVCRQRHWLHACRRQLRSVLLYVHVTGG